MSARGGFAPPGFSAAVYTSEREILWGSDDQHLPVIYRNSIISGAARDAGNTPTTLLRRGLLLGALTSGGELEEWDADASDGTQNIFSVLNRETRAQDFDANNVDRHYETLVKAPVIAKQLLIQGSAFIGHIDEYLARRQMHTMGFVFDDDPQGFYSGLVERYATVTGTSDTLTPQENGMILFYSNAASVTVTLPTIQPGLSYDLFRTGDEEFIVTSGAGNDIMFGNDLSGSTITYTTASEHLGARVRVRSVYVGTTLKWMAETVNTPFGTDAGSAVTTGIA